MFTMRASAGYGKPADSAAAVQSAWRAGLVVPAFNVPYLAMIEPIVRAVTDMDSFAFIATAPVEWRHYQSGGLKEVLTAFNKFQQPDYVQLHLDHVPVSRDGASADAIGIIGEASKSRYDSVMLDGSALPLEENIEVTRQAVDVAHRAGIPCEAELGAAGAQDPGTLPSYRELYDTGRGFTDVPQAQRFVSETHCDWLAVAVGMVHGLMASAPRDAGTDVRPNLDRLVALRDATCVPLVLHGAASLTRDDVHRVARAGVAKITVARETRTTYEKTLRETGSVNTAQEDVYEHVCWLLQEHFEVAGMRSVVMGDNG